MKKKVLSLMLAAALCSSASISALAAEEEDLLVTNKEVTTEGTVDYVDTTVYKVTLPTDGCFNFTVDPQGILSATDPTNYGEEKYPEGTAGYIVASEKTGAYINNMSSVPIKLTVDASIQNGEGEASSVNLLDLDQWELVNSGIDNNMMLTFDITNDNIDVEKFTDENGIETGDSLNPNVIAITKNAPADKGTQISFALNKAAYEFKKATDITYEMVAGETGDPVGMRLSGFVNVNADWKGFTGDEGEKIVVKTVFSFSALSTDYEVAAFDGRAHGVLEDRTPEYFAGWDYNEETGEPGVGPAAGEMEYTVGQGALEIPFDFGTGVSEVTITSITIGDEVAPTDYKVINGVITFKSTGAQVKGAMDGAVVDAATKAEAGEEYTGTATTVVITTSDEMTTTITVYIYG